MLVEAVRALKAVETPELEERWPEVTTGWQVGAASGEETRAEVAPPKVLETAQVMETAALGSPHRYLDVPSQSSIRGRSAGLGPPMSAQPAAP